MVPTQSRLQGRLNFPISIFPFLSPPASPSYPVYCPDLSLEVRVNGAAELKIPLEKIHGRDGGVGSVRRVGCVVGCVGRVVLTGRVLKETVEGSAIPGLVCVIGVRGERMG